MFKTGIIWCTNLRNILRQCVNDKLYGPLIRNSGMEPILIGWVKIVEIII